MISQHFSREEFSCRCGCGFNTVDCELLVILEEVRNHFNKPITINSGCRCESHNKSIGGSDKSQHKLGRASDIVVKGVNPHDVFTWLNDNLKDKYGLGNYETFTHIDTRDNKARW